MKSTTRFLPNLFGKYVPNALIIIMDTSYNTQFLYLRGLVGKAD